MTSCNDLNAYLELYQDFLHPNPNINSQAILLLKKDFKVEFMKKLLNNLKEEDVILRRKSILALGEYGEEVLNELVPLYLNSNNNIVKASCLKVMIKLVVNSNLKQLNQESMFIVELALKDRSPEIILIVISLLRQLGNNGRNILMESCRDKDLLIAKASISALLEMKDHSVNSLFEELLNDKSIDPMIREDILRDKAI